MSRPVRWACALALAGGAWLLPAHPAAAQAAAGSPAAAQAAVESQAAAQAAAGSPAAAQAAAGSPAAAQAAAEQPVVAQAVGAQPPLAQSAPPQPAQARASSAGTMAQTAAAKPAAETAQAVRIVVGLTLLAVLPALLVCLTSFLRIIIVLSMLRHAIGMPETPPNTVLIGLALFLTLFTMSPVLETANRESLQPFLSGRLAMEPAWEKGAAPLREFMVRQTREQDLALMVEISRARPPSSMADISNVQLVPAFMLSELRAAFQIGFVVFLPFLLIDLIVSSVLMSLGMMMMPPTTVALPLKILMFILVDGWSLLLKALVGSFH
jgi:flagellar biosynthetic protein FliP